MRDPIRRIVVPALLATLLAPAAADACRCVPRSPTALARAADAIVVAEAIGIDDRDPAGRSYQLRVTSSWKTRLEGPLVVRSDATTCQAELVVGHRYLVYLKRAGGGYWTDACSGNLPIGQAAPAMAVLGRATTRR